jgi:hypothetical protein
MAHGVLLQLCMHGKTLLANYRWGSLPTLGYLCIMSDGAQARFETNSWASREETPSPAMGTALSATVQYGIG